MIERAIADGFAGGLVLADSAYGDNIRVSPARAREVWATPIGLHRTTTVWRLDLLGRTESQ